MIGETFGRLTVISFSHFTGKHRRHYLCRCECGQEKTIQKTLLKNGNTRSCGCLSREQKLGQRLPNDAGVINHLLLQYKRHARDRGIDFHLTRSRFEILIRSRCDYCGDPAGNLKKTKNLPKGFPHNGVDRIDSKRPYEDGNVVPCCGTCNRAKAAMSREAFIALARRIAFHQNKGLI